MNGGTANSFNWRNALNETYENISQRVIDYAPHLLGAILLLALGWVVAKFLRLSTSKLVEGLESLFRRVSKNNDANRVYLKQSYKLIISQAVFWIVLLFFIAASANLLGWNMFTGWMESIISFLPKLITGLFIVLIGFLMSGAVRSAISSSTLHTGHFQINRLARTAQSAIILTAVIIGAEQMGLNMHFLTNIIVVIIGIVLAGACLAFALGAKTMAANAIGAQYTRKNCSIGEYLKVGDTEGEILEIRQTCIVLETSDGRAIIPGKFFHEQVSLLPSMEVETKIVKEGGSNE